MLITVITLVLAAAGFVWGRIRADIVALIALLILTLAGIITGCFRNVADTYKTINWLSG